MKRGLALVLLALLAGTACTGSDPRCASLPGGGRYCLQPTAAVQPFDAQQKVNFSFDERREITIVELEVDADGMRFAALTPFGNTVMQAEYDNRQVNIGTWPDRRLQPAMLLALLQLALWPAESVRAGLQDSLTLEESGGTRRFTAAGETMLTIIRVGETAPYHNMQFEIPAYRLSVDIESLPQGKAGD